MARNVKINYKVLEYRYKLLSELMEHIPDVIYFKDKKGRLIMVNQAHARGLGLKPEEVVGKTDFDFFPKKRAQMMARDDLRVLKNGKPIIDKIERATRPDGVDNYVSTTKIPRYDDKGNIIGLVGITRDITWRKQLEYLKEEKLVSQKKLETLEELNTMKSEFISIVSHELRTPLAVVKEAVELIFDELAGPINEKQKEFLIKAKHNILHLKNIIEQLLDVSRIERGKLKLHYSLVNLNELLLNSSEFFKKLAQEKGIRLEYHLPRDQVNIFIDAERINQVISNLIDNAIKFTEQNGEIKVLLEILEAKVRVGVIDTGIGIDKKALPKLFNKFVQLSKTRYSEKKGIGLGLSIVKELVTKHSGEIWVESKLGVGSKFYFTLPRFYTKKILNKDVRDSINDLLNKGKKVYLVNLLIVNFRGFKERVKIKSEKLFKDLEEIIDVILEGSCKGGRKKGQLILRDYLRGEFSILFSEAKKEEIVKICNLFKNSIKRYFIENKIKDVFINIGSLPYFYEGQVPTAKELFADIYIYKVYIGAETRRFKRINYRTAIEVIFPEDEVVESSQTVDISEGGLCFISERPFKTDEKVKIRLRFLKRKKSFDIKARVAWKKDIEEVLGEPHNKYKIGLEFMDLKDKERRELSKLIK